MENRATGSSSPAQLDFFSTPQGRRREFFTRLDATDLGGNEFRAERGLDFRALLACDQVAGDWVGSWALGSGGTGTGGECRPMWDREAALSCAADGLDREIERQRLSGRASSELRRWLQGLGVL